ncbi:hypothetical protein LWI29_003915 [Acer saccharum]|uniref:Uncharacterized protein n=1 Tax=Acer saccharum TaxID=4024 RepID=A0AA39RGF5_ACESA|nr:hypothetical protein LWI29_003915 [Acer saccharum]
MGDEAGDGDGDRYGLDGKLDSVNIGEGLGGKDNASPYWCDLQQAFWFDLVAGHLCHAVCDQLGTQSSKNTSPSYVYFHYSRCTTMFFESLVVLSEKMPIVWMGVEF